MAENNVEYLRQHPDRVGNVAFTLARRREALQYRSFAVSSLGATLEPSPISKAPSKPPILAFVFSGQGAQWPQMGKELLESDPAFLDDIRTMDYILSEAKIPPRWSIKGLNSTLWCK